MLTRLAVVVALVGAFFTLSLCPTFALSESQQDAAIASLQATVAAQQTQINTLKGLLSSFSKKTDTTRTDGKKGTELYITGMNLHVVNGLGATDGDPNSTGTMHVNGLGNVIIGYNASRSNFGGTDARTGSHNLVVGDAQNYSSYGGVVFGSFNTISNVYASVTGGYFNTISRAYASVSGGYGNTASGFCASVSGGNNNTASGAYASVSGGETNTASGSAGQYSTSVSGGYNNTATGFSASVSGGNGRTATGEYDWVAGTLFQDK